MVTVKIQKVNKQKMETFKFHGILQIPTTALEEIQAYNISECGTECWKCWMRKHHNENQSSSSSQELMFSRSSGWEWEEQSFYAFFQSLSSLHRTCLVPRQIPGGLHTGFDRHEPGFLGQIVQCNHLCFKVLRGNSSAPFPFHGMTSVVATKALSWHRTLCI